MDKPVIDEIKQHVGIVFGRLESKIELIAEGHALLRAEMKAGIGGVKQEFSDVRSMIKLSYAEIDTRIGDLERDLADLKACVESVEAAVR